MHVQHSDVFSGLGFRFVHLCDSTSLNFEVQQVIVLCSRRGCNSGRGIQLGRTEQCRPRQSQGYQNFEKKCTVGVSERVVASLTGAVAQLRAEQAKGTVWRAALDNQY